MPTPAITLKLKRFRRRFGMVTPRVAVRRHFDWVWYAGALVAVAVVVASVVWWLAKRGEVSLIEAEVAQLRQRVQEQDAELNVLRLQTGTEQTAVRLERVTQERLAQRLHSLEQENAALKEDMSLFERLVPADMAESTLRIERIGIQSEPESGRYRYRLLVRFQPSRQEREFHGRLQLLLTTVQGGREIQVSLPTGREPATEFAVDVKTFLRKEAGFSLPPGTVIRRVEARILQGGTIKATQQSQF